MVVPSYPGMSLATIIPAIGTMLPELFGGPLTKIGGRVLFLLRYYRSYLLSWDRVPGTTCPLRLLEPRTHEPEHYRAAGANQGWVVPLLRKPGSESYFCLPAHASQARALRYSASARLLCRALSGVPWQPCHHDWPNPADHHLPAGPPQGALGLPRHRLAAWASDLPNLPQTVTTLVCPRSLPQKKAAIGHPPPRAGSDPMPPAVTD